MKRDAKSSLGDALETDELYVETVAGGIHIGNIRGLEYAREASERSTVQERLGVLEEWLKESKGKIASLEERVTSLTLSLEAYHILRNRFLSTFKRDKLGNATEADFRLISEGNRRAHGGDATADALLYAGRQPHRRDVPTYEKLYGLDPVRVAQITYKPTIDALNAYAGIVSSNEKRGSQRFYSMFAAFIAMLKEKGFVGQYLEDGGDVELKRVYWAFLNAVQGDVSNC